MGQDFVELENELITKQHTMILCSDEYGFNAPYLYNIRSSKNNTILCEIKFQEGPIEENGVNGVHNEDLIAIVIDRLEHFQKSYFECKENENAITKLQECLMWLRKRTDNRKLRNVEGTYNV